MCFLYKGLKYENSELINIISADADLISKIETDSSLLFIKDFLNQTRQSGEQLRAKEQEKQITPSKSTAKPTQESATKTTAAVTTEQKEGIAQAIGKSVKTKPKNLKGLLDVMTNIFSLNKQESEAAAVIGDVIIGNAAKRAGITKDEMYQRIAFAKAQMKDLPQGVKFQVDAWHGSPHQFDKFTTEKIGTGEGVQAFGWGLYFTDLESIARDYADKLSKPNHSKFRQKLLRDNPPSHVINDIIDFSEYYEYDYDKVLKALIKNENKEGVKYLTENKDLFNSVERNLYKVSLHKGKTPDQYTWLEWDKPVNNSVILKLAKAFNITIKVDDSKVKDIRKRLDAAINKGDSDLVDSLDLELLEAEYDFSKKGIDPIVSEIFSKEGINLANSNGEFLYKQISRKLKSDKEASLFLLDAGIDGIKYPAESISRGATSDTARGFNYVVFDENAVSIEEVIKFQKDALKARGAMMMAMDNQAIIYALTDPNVSTPLHELAHVYEHYLTDAERKRIEEWSGHKSGTIEFSEAFARGFEKFLADGEAPTPALQKYFDNFKQWLLDIYNGITNSEIDLTLNKEMKAIYADMVRPQRKSRGQQEADALARLKAAKEKAKSASSQQGIDAFAGIESMAKADREYTNAFVNYVAVAAKNRLIDAAEILQELVEAGFNVTIEEAKKIRNRILKTENLEKIQQLYANIEKQKNIIDKKQAEIEAKKEQIKDAKEQAKEEAATLNDVREAMKEIIDDMEIPSILTIKGTSLKRSVENAVQGIKSFKDAVKILDELEGLIANTKYQNQLTDAEKQRSRIKKLAKRKGLNKTEANALAEFSTINPRRLAGKDVASYLEFAKRITDAFTITDKKATAKDAAKTLSEAVLDKPFIKEIRDYVDAENAHIKNTMIAGLQKKLNINKETATKLVDDYGLAPRSKGTTKLKEEVDAIKAQDDTLTDEEAVEKALENIERTLDATLGNAKEKKESITQEVLRASQVIVEEKIAEEIDKKNNGEPFNSLWIDEYNNLLNLTAENLTLKDAILLLNNIQTAIREDMKYIPFSQTLVNKGRAIANGRVGSQVELKDVSNSSKRMLIVKNLANYNNILKIFTTDAIKLAKMQVALGMNFYNKQRLIATKIKNAGQLALMDVYDRYEKRIPNIRQSASTQEALYYMIVSQKDPENLSDADFLSNLKKTLQLEINHYQDDVLMMSAKESILEKLNKAKNKKEFIDSLNVNQKEFAEAIKKLFTHLEFKNKNGVVEVFNISELVDKYRQEKLGEAPLTEVGNYFPIMWMKTMETSNPLPESNQTKYFQQFGLDNKFRSPNVRLDRNKLVGAKDMIYAPSIFDTFTYVLNGSVNEVVMNPAIETIAYTFNFKQGKIAKEAFSGLQVGVNNNAPANPNYAIEMVKSFYTSLLEMSDYNNQATSAFYYVFGFLSRKMVNSVFKQLLLKNPLTQYVKQKFPEALHGISYVFLRTKNGKQAINQYRKIAKDLKSSKIVSNFISELDVQGRNLSSFEQGINEDRALKGGGKNTLALIRAINKLENSKVNRGIKQWSEMLSKFAITNPDDKSGLLTANLGLIEYLISKNVDVSNITSINTYISSLTLSERNVMKQYIDNIQQTVQGANNIDQMPKYIQSISKGDRAYLGRFLFLLQRTTVAKASQATTEFIADTLRETSITKKALAPLTAPIPIAISAIGFKVIHELYNQFKKPAGDALSDLISAILGDDEDEEVKKIKAREYENGAKDFDWKELKRAVATDVFTAFNPIPEDISVGGRYSVDWLIFTQTPEYKAKMSFSEYLAIKSSAFNYFNDNSNVPNSIAIIAGKAGLVWLKTAETLMKDFNSLASGKVKVGSREYILNENQRIKAAMMTFIDLGKLAGLTIPHFGDAFESSYRRDVRDYSFENYIEQAAYSQPSMMDELLKKEMLERVDRATPMEAAAVDKSVALAMNKYVAKKEYMLDKNTKEVMRVYVQDGETNKAKLSAYKTLNMLHLYKDTEAKANFLYNNFITFYVLQELNAAANYILELNSAIKNKSASSSEKAKMYNEVMNAFKAKSKIDIQQDADDIKNNVILKINEL